MVQPNLGRNASAVVEIKCRVRGPRGLRKDIVEGQIQISARILFKKDGVVEPQPNKRDKCVAAEIWVILKGESGR